MYIPINTTLYNYIYTHQHPKAPDINMNNNNNNNTAAYKFYLVGGFITFFYTILSSYLLNGYLEPNECIEFPENPEYHVINTGSSSDHEVYGRYRLVYVHIKKEWGKENDKVFDLNDEDIWSGAPVLFIPGHAGSYNQSKTLAAQVQSQMNLKKGEHDSIRFFALDFREDLSAFNGHFLEAQAEFVNNCVRFILNKCIERANEKHVVGPKSVLLVAHSMGGIAARGALFAKNYLQGSILTIITLNTPHRAISPLMTDQRTIQYYSQLNKMWYDKTAAAEKVANNNNNHKYHTTTFQTIVVSIAGGHRDTKIRSDLTSLTNIIVGKYNYLQIWSGAMDGVWFENDHDSIMWCGQLIIILSQTLIDLLDIQNNGGQFYYDKITRYNIIKNGLVGNTLGNTFFESVPKLINNDDNTIMTSTKKSTEIFLNLAKDVDTVSHCINNGESSNKNNDRIMDSAFVLLSNASSIFLQNKVQLSLCRGLSCNSCESPLSTTEIKAILQRFPNGLKRTHLHHSYDPKMNYGEKRHVYKWTRASKVALLDNFENDDSLGGSLNLLYISNSYLQDGHQSIRIMMNKENDNTNKDNKWNDVTDENRKNIFISAQYIRTKKKENANNKIDTNHNNNEGYASSYNSYGYYTFFTYLLFGTETMVLPINHPMVIDISPAVRMFNNRFLPQLLTIEKIKCKKPLVTFQQHHGHKMKVSHHENFQPVVRYIYYNESFLHRNKIHNNLEVVEESIASPRPLSFKGNVYKYNINGHYRKVDSIVINLISDPTCSYNVHLNVDLLNVPNAFNRYILPKSFSLTFVTGIILVSIQLFSWKKEQKIPMSLPKVIFETKHVLYMIIGLTFLASLKLFFTCTNSTPTMVEADMKIHASADDCKLSTFTYCIMIIISSGCLIVGHLSILLTLKVMQIIVLFYVHVFVWIKGRPPFDGRSRKRSRSNSDVEEQQLYDNNKKKDGPRDGNNKGAVTLASNDNMKLIYFLIRTIALYTMLCLRPILILSILMIYRGFKEAFVYAEITYLNLVYRPANEKQSILYAIKCIFFLNEDGSSSTAAAMHNNVKDYSLETILLINLTFIVTQATTLLLDVRTLFSFYNSNDIPLPYFQSLLLLPGVLVLYYNKRRFFKEYVGTWPFSMLCGIGGFLFALDYLHDAYYVYFMFNLVIFLKNSCYVFRKRV